MGKEVDHSTALHKLGWESLKVERKKAKAKIMNHKIL